MTAATPRRRFLVVALGSAGDVHPFVAVGRRLAERGHEVTLFANEVFEETVEAAGLAFAAMGDAETYRRVTADPDVWHPRRGPRRVFAETMRHLPEMVAVLEQHLQPGRTVLVASTLGLGARILQERQGVPLATVHLQPAVLRSALSPPLLPGAPMASWAPAWWNRLVWRLGDRVLRPVLEEPLNAARSEMGLPPVRRPLDRWWHSPQRVIGLFPPWFAPPPADWPPQLVLTGFPLWDEAEQRPPDPELDAWLAAGEPPLALTPGSANRHAAAFFRHGVEACRRLGRRGLLLTGERADLPDELPEGFLHRDFAPFSRVFPRAAAVVHHGGIGTCAQALAAAVPQLVVPFSHDQFDNASRLERLGVAATLPARRLGGPAAARALRDLLASAGLAERARELAARSRDGDPLGETCRHLEALGATRFSG